MANKNIILFVVFHDQLTLSYYAEDLLTNYSFINVRPENPNASNYDRLLIKTLQEFPEFYSLGKWYTESEVIYNIYKNPVFLSDKDYVGFLQYDIDSTPLNFKVLQDSLINNDHINFQPIEFTSDYNQRILMDPTKANTLTGNGINCYDAILEDYNKYYSTTYRISDLSGLTLNLCSSFLMTKTHFNEMMSFVAFVIESKRLDKYDPNHKYRIQGGFLERYYAVWIGLKNLRTAIIPLIHHYKETIAQNSNFLHKMKRIFFRLLKKSSCN